MSPRTIGHGLFTSGPMSQSIVFYCSGRERERRGKACWVHWSGCQQTAVGSAHHYGLRGVSCYTRASEGSDTKSLRNCYCRR
ncbi:hypothetical protein DPEC_G00300700 [Dallia pectoralis]|uniref:Uncharacterized protein n=1 Tax=Dallia pectoralis TaxID=75939 RepID=A0ACC2FGI5_DALPE|nr:hypothetical protein DPEC_G00300700 [Dallia pectoralis]